MLKNEAGRTATLAATTAALALAWSGSALAVNLPVLYVSVDGGADVSFENDQVCDGASAVTCFGTGAAGDLLISSFELSADPAGSVAGSFNFYNASANMLNVTATILYSMTGSYSAPTLGLGSGLVNNVFGGGIYNILVAGVLDPPTMSPSLAINEAAPGVPFTVCEDLSFDLAACQGITSVSVSQAGPPSLDVLSSIALSISFDLTPDTTATIGLDPSEAYGGGAYFSVTPGPVVPVPGAVWLFGSALGAMGWLRRKTAS